MSSDYFYGIGVPNDHFDYVIIDEGAQMLEAEALVPLQLVSEHTIIIMSGDPQQMGPPVFSDSARNHGFGISIMERMRDLFINKGIQNTHTFHKNYRNNKDILHLPSKWFYNGRLQASKTMKNSSFSKWKRLQRGVPTVRFSNFQKGWRGVKSRS